MTNLLIMFGGFLILVSLSVFYDKSYKEGYPKNNSNISNANSSTANNSTANSSTANDNINARINELIDDKLNSSKFAEVINELIDNYNKTDKFENRVKDLLDENISSSFTNEDESNTFEGYEIL